MKKISKQAIAFGVAGLLVGGFGGFSLLEPETVYVKDDSAINALQEQVNGLTSELFDANKELDKYSEFIEMAIAEDTAEETALQYLEDKDYKLQDWLNSEFNLSIEDDDDLSMSRFEEIDVDSLDYEEGEFDITGEFRVDYFEDGDEDLDGKKYVKFTIEVRDFEAESISFEEL